MSKRWWRDYRTPAGRRPVKEFIAELDDADAEEVLAAMKDVQTNGLVAARHLRGGRRARAITTECCLQPKVDVTGSCLPSSSSRRKRRRPRPGPSTWPSDAFAIGERAADRVGVPRRAVDGP